MELVCSERFLCPYSAHSLECIHLSILFVKCLCGLRYIPIHHKPDCKFLKILLKILCTYNMALALVSTLLLVFGIMFCTSHGSDLVVLTTADRLREEIRSQLDEALEDSLPELCTRPPQNYGSPAQPPHLIDAIKEAVNETVSDLLDPLISQLSHLMTPGYTPSHPATSCKEILELAPDSLSGLYWIRGTDNGAGHCHCHSADHMYCDMERNCNGVGGGWMRVASIDMTDPSSTCPSGLRTIFEGSHRLCAMNIDNAGCSSAILPVEGVQYSRVCGKIIGYQQGSPDAFRGGQTTIDSHYVDGISLTHGNSPRKHIWTFAAALHEYNSHSGSVCPCTNTQNNPPPAVPPFVGQDYFCDTGSENHFQHIFYANDPLWDGSGCGQFSTCCSLNSPPWFLKELSPPTSDDIEMRMCCDSSRSDEDITFETLEIYVQ